MDIKSISNTNFQGHIRWRVKNTCPESIINAIKENRVINEFLNGKKDLVVNIKHRLASKLEVQKCSRDDDLYKIIFSSSSHPDSILGRISDFFSSKSVRLAKDYDHHSEHTNLRYLANEMHMRKIFDKLA